MKIIKILSLIDNEDRETWFKVGSLLKTELGEEGLDYWKEWSKTSDKYDESTLLSQWKSIEVGKHNFYWLQKNFLEGKSVEFNRYMYSKGILKLPKDVQIIDDIIVIPIYLSNGQIVSYQTITERGTKSFKSKAKLFDGHYLFSRNSTRLIIAEGFATANSIYKAFTDLDVMVSFSKNRIKTLIKNYSKNYTEVYVALDSDVSEDFTFNKQLLDCCTNTIALPSIKNVTDFNDLEKYKGIIFTQKTIKSQLVKNSVCLTPMEFKVIEGSTFITLKGSSEKLFDGWIEVDSFTSNDGNKIINFKYHKPNNKIKKVTVSQKDTAQKNKLLEVIDRFDLEDTGLLYLKQNNQKYILALIREFFKDKYLTHDKQVVEVHNYGINKDGYAKGEYIYFKDAPKLKASTSCEWTQQILSSSKVDTGIFKTVDESWEYLKEIYPKLYSDSSLMQQFMLCVGVGIVSYSFFCENEDVGGVISLVSDKSGIGKTHICNRVMSMYIKPQGLFIAGTEAGTKIGVGDLRVKLNSIPLFWDEITAVDKLDIEEFIFNSTKKASRIRGNEDLKFLEQHNFCISTSNVSINTILMGDERGKEAISKRVFEIFCSESIKVNKYFRKELSTLNGITGVVGEKVLEYVLLNYEKEKELYEKGRDYVEDRFSLDTTYRFITNILNCAYMGNRIAKEIGLFDFNMTEIESFIQDQLDLSNTFQVDETEINLEKIKNLIAMNQDKIVKLNGKGKTPINYPARQVAILDDGEEYFITCSFLKSFFTKQKDNHLLITKQLEQSGKAKVINKRVPQIYKGSIVMRCLKVDKKLMI